ncbi:unnamed protein product [Toxocara canis]|uniref:ATP-dependent DNA helicase n=1 Tax=Toxocara canis TaxID=6265 RepID=A0A3P7FK97_TOXCA|nr:unnamed protein product [Toxocara canis]
MRHIQRILNAVGQDLNAYGIAFEERTGKTFIYNLIIRILRMRGTGTVAVAFTGIAATLLIGGTTVHSRFRLPLHFVSTMKADSEEANAIRKCPLIVWDEACTQKRYALEAVERLLRDIAIGELKTAPFGGHVILLGGDWRQMLPISYLFRFSFYTSTARDNYSFFSYSYISYQTPNAFSHYG